MNFRLSYNDIKLFLAIAQSLSTMSSPEVRESPLQHPEQELDGEFHQDEDLGDLTTPIATEHLVKRLLPLGFTKSSIRKELYLHDNEPNAAALKLLSQQDEGITMVASSDSQISTETVDGEKKKSFSIKSIQVELKPTLLKIIHN